MPGKSFEVDVKPELINWAITTSGEQIDEISRHINISSGNIRSWTSGSAKPTYSQLEHLALHLKRPVAVFFLPKAPAEKKPPKDYRMIPDKADKFSTKTILSIRRARRLQSIGKELQSNIHLESKPIIGTATLKDSSETIANKEREASGITFDIQRKWSTPNDALNAWREYFENKNILVFQMSMDIKDAAGFSITDELPYTIVLNTSDSPERRIFTLMHEYAHILLRESGVCLPETKYQSAGHPGVEKWCNDFAAAFLVPKTEIKKDFEADKGKLLDNEVMKKLVKKYKVSRQMLMVQMVKMGYLPQATYDKIAEAIKNKAKEKFEGFVPPDVKCVSQHGRKFISLVSSNMAQGHITNSQAIDFLSIKLKNLDKVMKRSSKDGSKKK